MWLTSWKARQVIALRCCFAFVYIYISIPVNLRHLDCTIASCSLLVCRRQLQTPLRQNLQRICVHKHFNGLGGITSLLASHIVWLRATWFLPVGHFLAYIILPAWPRPLPLLSWGDIQVPPPRWICAWAVQISGWQLRSRLWSRQSTYIQLIVLQEVCTSSSILLKSVTSEPPAFYVCPSIYRMARNFGGLAVLSAISQYFICHQFYSNWAETSSWPVKFSVHSISHFVMNIIIAKTSKVNSAK